MTLTSEWLFGYLADLLQAIVQPKWTIFRFLLNITEFCSLTFFDILFTKPFFRGNHSIEEDLAKVLQVLLFKLQI